MNGRREGKLSQRLAALTYEPEPTLTTHHSPTYNIPMRVKEITAWQVRIPLKKPIQHASHTRTETDNLVVRVVLDDGSEGFGEGVPRDYVTGETIESSLALLKQSELSVQLEQCSSFHSALTIVERLRLAPIPNEQRGCRGNAARCA